MFRRLVFCVALFSHLPVATADETVESEVPRADRVVCLVTGSTDQENEDVIAKFIKHGIPSSQNNGEPIEE